MLLPLKKLLRKGETPLHVTGEFDFKSYDFPGYSVPFVCCNLQAAPIGDAIRLHLEIEATICMPCARCLESAQSNLHISKSYDLYAEHFEEEYPEYPILQDGRLDLDEMVYQEVLMEAPVALYCREDCPGLCPKCGKHKQHCNCPEEEEGDPRLQILKTLLQ